jgi:hypothetical protein
MSASRLDRTASFQRPKRWRTSCAGGRVRPYARLATSAVLDTVAVTIAGSGGPGPSRLQGSEPVHGHCLRLLWSAASFSRFDAA